MISLSIKKKYSSLELICIFAGGLVLLFIAAPLVTMFFKTEPAKFVETVKDKEVTDSIFLTIWTSMAATLISGLFAIPFSYFLARNEFFGKKFVLGILNLPVIIPHSAAGLAVLGFVARGTIIGGTAAKLGFTFVGGEAGIVLAMAFVSVPFLLNSAYEGFRGVDIKIENAARTLGASPIRVFLTISLPLAWRYVLSGIVLMWARGISEFGAIVIIAYHPMTAPVLVFERFGAFGLKYARPASVLLISVCLIFFAILRFLADRKENDRS